MRGAWACLRRQVAAQRLLDPHGGVDLLGGVDRQQAAVDRHAVRRPDVGEADLVAELRLDLRDERRQAVVQRARGGALLGVLDADDAQRLGQRDEPVDGLHAPDAPAEARLAVVDQRAGRHAEHVRAAEHLRQRAGERACVAAVEHVGEARAGGSRRSTPRRRCRPAARPRGRRAPRRRRRSAARTARRPRRRPAAARARRTAAGRRRRAPAGAGAGGGCSSACASCRASPRRACRR